MRTGIPTAKLITALRYRDVGRAAEWLCAAFGFELRASMVGGDGRAGMAQLTYGSNLIMLLPVGGSELDSLMKQPDEIGGAETQSCYLVVGDVEAHHACAQAAGAEIISALKAFDNGGEGYTCRDLEGHIWSFGTYDPLAAAPAGLRSSTASLIGTGKRLSVPALFAALIGMIAVAATGWAVVHTHISSSIEEDLRQLQVRAAKEGADKAIDLVARHAAELAQERDAKEAARRNAQHAQEHLAREQGAREVIERSLRQLEMEAVEERRAKIAAEKAVSIAKDMAARERGLKQAAEGATAEVRKELMLDKAARLKAERAVQEAAEQLARERAARVAAERAAKEAQDKLKQAQGPPQGGIKPAKQPATQAAPTKKAASSSGSPAFPPLVP